MSEEGKQAIKPSFMTGLPIRADLSTGKPIENIGDEEKHLEALSRHSGWRVLETYIDDLMDELERITDAGMAQGLSLEEIGRNALVANLSKGMIRRIKEKVQDAKEAVDKENGLTK